MSERLQIIEKDLFILFSLLLSLYFGSLIIFSYSILICSTVGLSAAAKELPWPCVAFNWDEGFPNTTQSYTPLSLI